MLSTFCNSLSDEAQLKLALRLGKLALPAWNLHFCEDPVTINQLKELTKEANRLQSGVMVDDGFPKKVLVAIEQRYQAAKTRGGNPIVILKGDATLSPLLAASKKVLTHPQWESQLPEPVRFVFTLTHNLLVWILERRKNEDDQTLVYVSIHQATDVLLRQLGKSELEINTILAEYMLEKRGTHEDAEWEAALPIGERAPDEEAAMPKIAETKSYSPQSYEVLRQMREEGKSYWNELDDFNTGTSTTYSYKKEKKSYWFSQLDAVVGSFNHQLPMTETEMLDFVSDLSVVDLRASGFVI